MTRARLFLSPLDGALAEIEIVEPTRLLEIFPDAEVMEWFEQGGTIALNGEIIPPDRWRHVTVKPRPHLDLNFIYVPRGKKTFALLATVALVALTTAISGGLLGPAGFGFLGSSFAAGGIGANLLAGAVGLAGSLAVAALTAPPRSSNTGNEQTVVSAGVNGNVVSILEPLPVVFGKIGFSPPHLMPPYTAWDGDNLTAYAVVGLHGRCLVENVKVNGLPAADVPGLLYETREGTPGEATRTIAPLTVIEERDGVTLTNFVTEMATSYNDVLNDQDDPDKSSPQWHMFRTAGDWNEAVLRFLFSSGIVYTPNGVPGFVALRIEIRKVGAASWRRMPTLHVADQRAGSGPLRVDVRLVRTKKPGGRTIIWAHDDYPVTLAHCATATGQSFAYQSDSYFCLVSTRTTPMVTMTGPTTSGITITASSVNSTDAAWKVRDNDPSADTYWRPADNSLPADLIIQFSTAQTIKSYDLGSDAAGNVGNFYANTPTTSPLEWEVYGSTDGVTYVALDDSSVDISSFPLPFGTYQIGHPDAYTHYKFRFLRNNGAANQEMRVNILALYNEDAPGVATKGYDTEDYKGMTPVDANSGFFVCANCDLDKRGAIIYLDPDQWEDGEYEIRVKRSAARHYSGLNMDGYYRYVGYAVDPDYFDYRLIDGQYKVYVGQKDYRSDCLVEAFQTIANEAPFDDTGVCTVAIALPNSQISSIYAEFTRYAVTWDGSSWTNTPVPTRNPAAMYRQLLLGECNAKPVPGECLDEDGLADWYEDCVTNGYQCNAVLQGRVIDVPKQMLATCGFASPRDAESYGVVQDRDTSAEPVRYIISPANSRDTGTKQELPDLPDAIRAEFNDEDQSYAVEHVIIYRDGMSAATAKVFETITYQGFTALAKVQQRALFDLRQAQFRQVRYNRVVGFDGIVLNRGDLVGLSCDVIDGDKAAGWIAAITTVGPDVVSITLDNVMPWSVSQGLEGVDDFSAITDMVDISEPMGVAIRIPGAPALLKQVSDISDSNVCTFVTPFALAGSGLAVNQLVAAGRWGSVMRRCKIMSVKPKGLSQRAVVLADEAPNLFT